VKTDLFDYRLPPERIAQTPAARRDLSRLLIVRRNERSFEDRTFAALPDFLSAGDLLVLNDTRVIPARLRARRESGGGKVEILLLPDSISASNAPDAFVRRAAFTKAGGRLQPGETLLLAEQARAVLVERRGEAGDALEFQMKAAEFEEFLRRHGEVPLPPYIRRTPGPSADEDRERYQTCFAAAPGAIAAPTAGLHFTPELLEKIAANGVRTAFLTLHVGPGTFRPVKVENTADHVVAPEPYVLPAEVAAQVKETKEAGRKVFVVGTTSLRVLEGAFDRQTGALRPGAGMVSLYIRPPFRFHVADALLTNFHLPKSSLLILASAFAAPEQTDGVELVRAAYAHALRGAYRFYSYGDACLFL
jgi:S-adenosylmethionine:tRNA ribosyltransferase-isomerase